MVQSLSQEEPNVKHVCDVLGVSRSAYYAWRQSCDGRRVLMDNRLRPEIRRVFRIHKRRYGARRVAKELTALDQPCGRRRVGRLLNAMGLKAIQPRSFKPRTTDSRHSLGYSPNLVLGAPPPTAINQLWVGDITYVPLIGGNFLYLSILMDRYSRRIVGWDLQDHMQESLVLAALRAAIVSRQPTPSLVHHSDRGGQYAGTEYRQALTRAGMRQSMSRANDCYDNAFMESCFGKIKTELEMKPYQNSGVARKEIPAFIRYYNTRRRHSALKYVSPEEFERVV